MPKALANNPYLDLDYSRDHTNFNPIIVHDQNKAKRINKRQAMHAETITFSFSTKVSKAGYSYNLHWKVYSYTAV